jgi:hypothetical protein
LSLSVAVAPAAEESVVVVLVAVEPVVPEFALSVAPVVVPAAVPGVVVSALPGAGAVVVDVVLVFESVAVVLVVVALSFE